MYFWPILLVVVLFGFNSHTLIIFIKRLESTNEQGAANFLGETGQNMQLPYANNTLAFTITYNSEQYEEFDDAEAAFAPQFSAIEQV